MSKKPAIAQQLRTTKRDLRDALDALNHSRVACESYRMRATKAEQEAADWKRRFDVLIDKLRLHNEGGSQS